MSTLAVSTTKMTASQYLALGEDPPGVRLELVEGEIAVSPSPSPRHGFTEYALATFLNNHLMEHDLGQVFPDIDTILDEFNVRRPDLIYFRKDRLHLVGEQVMEGPPDLGVEIVSPTSDGIDREDKFRPYREFGVAHYWIVDPQARTLEGFTLQGNRYAAAGRAAGGQSLALPPFEDPSIPLGRLGRPESSSPS